jgi:hypothetical protein
VPVTEYLDNPAGRLHRLLVRFRQNASNTQAWRTWAATLGISDTDYPEVARGLGMLLALPGEAESELAQVDPADYPGDIVLRWKDKIVPALVPHLFEARQADQMAAGFDDASLGFLETCSWTLHRYRPQRLIADSDVERIQKLIDELYSELRTSVSIDRELRVFLLEQCEEMTRALRDMEIRGPAALEEALDRAVGAAHRRADLAARSSEAPGVWRKFGEVLVVVAAALQIATSAVALPGQVQQAIEGPPPPAQVQVVEVSEPGQPPTADTPAQHPNGEGTSGGAHPQAAGGAPG